MEVTTGRVSQIKTSAIRRIREQLKKIINFIMQKLEMLIKTVDAHYDSASNTMFLFIL